MVEERIHDGRCGYPLCRNQLSKVQFQYLSKKTASLDTYGPMLADILTGTHPRKDLNKALERQLLFCQQSCNDKSLLMERRFDNTASYTREVVLQNHEALSSTALFNTSSMLQSTHIIDTLLPFLAIPDQTTKQLVKEENVEVNETPAPVVLPAVMDQSGCVSVVFNEGLPTSVHSHTISAISIANNATTNNNFPPSRLPLTTKDDNIDIKYRATITLKTIQSLIMH